jgi:hypothetical protein
LEDDPSPVVIAGGSSSCSGSDVMNVDPFARAR